MSTPRLHNFAAGPSMMPLEVLKEIKSGFMEFDGVSILELFHRSKRYVAFTNETCNLVRELLEVPRDFEIMIIQAGASLQFAAIPMNFLKKRADYAITGLWAQKAYNESKLVGPTHVAFTSEKEKFTYVPVAEEFNISKNTDYLHITSNNTAYGTQFDVFPKFKGVPLVVDMTSDLFTRRMDWKTVDMVYASTQKNAGTAGACVIIIRKDFLKRASDKVPLALSLKAHAEAGSILSTPPAFPIYVTNLMLRWMIKNGGIDAMETNNLIKASMLYGVIEDSDIYTCPNEESSRSSISVIFDLPNKKMLQQFIDGAAKIGLTGIAGHTIRGGIRVTVGNGVPMKSVKLLADYMKKFEKR